MLKHYNVYAFIPVPYCKIGICGLMEICKIIEEGKNMGEYFKLYYSDANS